MLQRALCRVKIGLVTRDRDRKAHAVEYDVCGGRLRLLPPLPFDVQSLLKALRPRNTTVISDQKLVAIVRDFENKAKRSSVVKQDKHGAQQQVAAAAAAVESAAQQQPLREGLKFPDLRCYPSHLAAFCVVNTAQVLEHDAAAVGGD